MCDTSFDITAASTASITWTDQSIQPSPPLQPELAADACYTDESADNGPDYESDEFGIFDFWADDSGIEDWSDEDFEAMSDIDPSDICDGTWDCWSLAYMILSGPTADDATTEAYPTFTQTMSFLLEF